MDGIYTKYSMSVPIPQGLGQGKEVEVKEESKGVVDKVKDVAEAINPFNLVDKAGNFALRAVVVIVATGLIMLGFYFMFSGSIKDLAKQVVT